MGYRWRGIRRIRAETTSRGEENNRDHSVQTILIYCDNFITSNTLYYHRFQLAFRQHCPECNKVLKS